MTVPTTYRCRDCGHEAGKWLGFCPQCRGGPLAEVTVLPGPAAMSIPADATRPVDRLHSGSDEIDRVLGGGVVPGAAMLLGGEPGVGKSTLTLQWAALGTGSTLVVSAEESIDQVALRAHRVGAAGDGVTLAETSEVAAIIDLAERVRPGLLVVDSIQTVTAADVAGTAGGVAQVRECAARLAAYAKTSATPVVLTGHVTKEGALAGPKLLEHMVDVVLSLEGDPDRGARFLRSTKNRYGTANEVGVFSMTAGGLVAVPDPSEALVADRDGRAPGSILFPSVEGRRVILVEVQALVVPATTPQPRRSSKGIPIGRLHQVLAVLERHGGISTAGHDVYVSVLGGATIREPAADLPLAIAIASARRDAALGSMAAWGEVGLTGEIRPALRGRTRRAEADRFAVETVLGPDDDVPLIADAVGQALRNTREVTGAMGGV